jgi:hypothetical protein
LPALELGGASIDSPAAHLAELRAELKTQNRTRKRDWKDNRFAEVPGDEQEFVPLPE